MRVLFAAVVAIAGCYRPGDVPNCALTCAGASECPDGLGCGTSGLCSSDNQCAGDLPMGDASDDVPSPELCFGTFWQPCVALADGPVSLFESDFDSDLDPRCIVKTQPGAAVASCVIAADSITASVNFRAHGARPLVLVADSITVDGLDVSSSVGENGAGACVDLALATMNGTQVLGSNNDRYGGGGAGGSFSGMGGSGGFVSINGGMASGGGDATSALQPPAFAIGGCPGGDGGVSDVANSSGPAGRGGGAVVLIARTAITITGSIDASGSGGLGARRTRGGGGGGGAGGMIVLDAPTLRLMPSSRLLAGGGGGGAGGGDNDEVQNAGGAPDINAASGLATTGRGATSSTGSGGDGGDGSTEGRDAGNAGGDNASAGGGGGGGSAGFILMFTVNRDDMAKFEVPMPILAH